MSSKLCRTCNTIKPLDEFHKRAGTKDGKQSNCKSCNIARVKKWQSENAGQFKSYWSSPAVSHRSRARRYGFTVDELHQFLRDNPSCRICETEDGLVVDHDHATGQVRGMLCTRCNLRLGWVEQVGLESIQNYLLGRVAEMD